MDALRRVRFTIGAFLIALLFGTVSQSVYAATFDEATLYVDIICTEESRRIGQLPRPIHIPVGCETIDCCPGCPADFDEIEWRVHLNGSANQAMRLSLENMNAVEVKNLRIHGPAVWLDKTTLLLEPGDVSIRHFPRRWESPLPAVLITLEIDAKSTTLSPDVTDDTASAVPESDASVVVDQFLGNVPVNRTIGRYRFRNCNWPIAPTPTSDKIVLLNNTSNDNAIIRFVARRASGCRDDNIYRSTSTAHIGSVLLNSGCRAETFVFSKENAMAWVPSTTTWTDPDGNIQSIPLLPLSQFPMTVWVLKQPTSWHSVAMDIDRMNDLLNSMYCGIEFAPVTIKTIKDAPSALLSAACEAKDHLHSQIGRNPGLNAYYVETVGGSYVASYWCGDDTIIVSATYSDNESLAHESGHSLSLKDTDLIAAPSDNLMKSTGAGRKSIALGQCFRSNMSMTRTCPHFNYQAQSTLPTEFCPETLWDLPR